MTFDKQFKALMENYTVGNNVGNPEFANKKPAMWQGKSVNPQALNMGQFSQASNNPPAVVTGFRGSSDGDMSKITMQLPDKFPAEEESEVAKKGNLAKLMDYHNTTREIQNLIGAEIDQSGNSTKLYRDKFEAGEYSGKMISLINKLKSIAGSDEQADKDLEYISAMTFGN